MVVYRSGQPTRICMECHATFLPDDKSVLGLLRKLFGADDLQDGRTGRNDNARCPKCGSTSISVIHY